MTAPLHVRVNDRWRRVVRRIKHPTGDRYELAPIEGEPSTVSVRVIERTPWRGARTPQPKLVS